jgi:hypothetical protein
LLTNAQPDEVQIEAGKCEGTRLEVNDSVKHPKRVHVGVIEEDEEKNQKDKEEGRLEWAIPMDEAGSVVKIQDAGIPGLKFKVEEQKGTDEMLKEVEAKDKVHEETSAAVDKEEVVNMIQQYAKYRKCAATLALNTSHISGSSCRGHAMGACSIILQSPDNLRGAQRGLEDDQRAR